MSVDEARNMNVSVGTLCVASPWLVNVVDRYPKKLTIASAMLMYDKTF